MSTTEDVIRATHKNKICYDAKVGPTPTAPKEVPMSLLSRLNPISLLAKATDHGFLTMTLRHSGEPPGQIPKNAREAMLELASFYQSLGEGFYPTPEAAAPVQRWIKAIEGGAVIDLSWESQYQPAFPEIRERYQGHGNNRTAHARFYRHETPRPAIICIHGYGGGHYSIEEFSFPVRWLFSLGLDVILPVLPFHQKRASTDGWPIFPNAGRVAMTNEGFGQAVFDLRALISFLLERGAPSVSVLGMSLGGYTTSLLATVEDRLSFAAPMIPFASYADLVWDHGQGLATQQRAIKAGIQKEDLAEAFAIHTPLKRAPKLSKERVMVAAGDADRVTPKEHAQKLKEHFQTEHFVLFPGGHLLQFGRGEAFRTLAKRLAALGLIEPK